MVSLLVSIFCNWLKAFFAWKAYMPNWSRRLWDVSRCKNGYKRESQCWVQWDRRSPETSTAHPRDLRVNSSNREYAGRSPAIIRISTSNRNQPKNCAFCGPLHYRHGYSHRKSTCCTDGGLGHIRPVSKSIRLCQLVAFKIPPDDIRVEAKAPITSSGGCK